MDITVILCTYNRCESLGKTLASVAMLSLPESVKWEVLVVDNNSSDQTRELVETFCHRYPGRFRYLFELQQGKSYALNSGIRACKSEILAFTDDDAIVQPEWLRDLTAPFGNDDCMGVGGRTLPETGFAPPDWLGLQRPYVYGPLGIFDLGDAPCKLTEPPFGNNMAYRREVFEKHGYFRTELGPRPGSEIRSEDTEFGQRVLTADGPLLYEPSAVLYHAIPSNRVQKDYLLKWWSAKSRANVTEFGVPSGTRLFLFGIPLYLFRRLGVWTLKWIFSFNAPKRFHNQVQVWSLTGEIKEHFAQSRLQKL
jgi:glucosyl-dolichyl phosphate glucuronosyltransferase